MAAITITGSFSKTDKFLNALKKQDIFRALNASAQKGVDALASATPVRTGLTADSWGAEVKKVGPDWTITWTNSHMNEGVNVAILLEFGHGTGTGGYVQGYDYINPAIRPIFDQIANEVWKAVTSA